MPLMELPVADLMTEPQSKPRSIINELLDTTHSGPMQRLADEGVHHRSTTPGKVPKGLPV
jgi:hypothetical protein